MAWKYNAEKEFLDQMKYRSDVILVPHSYPENIAKWVASATALILVSHYEGFGVPLVEAMACHVPVITSNIPPMSSISGKSGIHVSPQDSNELADAMKTFASNPEYRDQCIEVGREKVKDYNWDSAAQMIWDELERVINH
jgi:glycosyltransferase involved in cell wall biosynthesis